MAAQRIIHRLTLPACSPPEVFETFMQDRYVAALRTGPTRIGQIVDLRLLADSGHESTSYLLDVGFDGIVSDRMPTIDDEQVEAEFAAFGLDIGFLGCFDDLSVEDNDTPGTRIHALRLLTPGRDADAFAIFLQKRYLPGLHFLPSRTGFVTGLRLSKQTEPRDSATFLFDVAHVGALPPVDDSAVRAEFDGYEVQVDQVGSCTEALSWHNNQS